MFGPGEVANAFDLDGLDDHVRIPHAADLNPTGSFSIDAWIFPRKDSLLHIVAKWGDAGAWTNQRAYSFHTIPGAGLLFAISDDANQNNGTFHVFQVSGVLTLNAWNHVAAVYDQPTGTRILYVSGAEVARRTDPPIVVTTSVADLGIGAQLNAPGSFLLTFSGLIDEAELHSRALSPTEVAAIFNAGSAGKCKDEDGDGFRPPEDCDESSAAINPNAIELPGNFVDENCDGNLGSCDPCRAWRSHGEYVRCVSGEVESLMSVGTITQEEGDALVGSSARSDVGKKGFLAPECSQ
jgi:hypothetical protein